MQRSRNVPYGAAKNKETLRSLGSRCRQGVQGVTFLSLKLLFVLESRWGAARREAVARAALDMFDRAAPALPNQTLICFRLLLRGIVRLALGLKRVERGH